MKIDHFAKINTGVQIRTEEDVIDVSRGTFRWLCGVNTDNSSPTNIAFVSTPATYDLCLVDDPDNLHHDSSFRLMGKLHFAAFLIGVETADYVMIMDKGSTGELLEETPDLYVKAIRYGKMEAGPFLIEESVEEVTVGVLFNPKVKNWVGSNGLNFMKFIDKKEFRSLDEYFHEFDKESLTERPEDLEFCSLVNRARKFACSDLN